MHKDNSPQPELPFKEKVILIMLGLFLCTIILEVGLRMGGFIFLSLQEHRNMVSIKRKGSFRIMCLGESTTAGVGQNSYPIYLEEILNNRNIGIKFSVINKGVAGVNTTFIVNQLEDNINKYKPDMVITMTGYNDGESLIPYENTLTPKIIIFFRHFKTYKLFGILRLHILSKAKELGLYRPREDKGFTKLKPGISAIESKEADDSLKEAIKLDPGNDWLSFKLIWHYIQQEKFTQSEELLKKVIELNPRNHWVYLALGKHYYYKDQEKFAKVEELIKEVIESDPQNDGAYVGLGYIYKTQDKFTQAEGALKKAIELDPRNSWAYLSLGKYYAERRKYIQSEEAFKKAIEITPDNFLANIDLGMCYSEQGKFTQAEEQFKKTIELDPKSGKSYIELAGVYKDEGKFTQAEELLKRAIELNPKDDKVYGSLIALYAEMGKDDLMQETSKLVNRLVSTYYNPITLNNYQKIKRTLDKTRIELVCVQYPMRNIATLKNIFKEREEIIFVDNEKVFKEALHKATYKEYFLDMIGGDFGHCTRKGNRLLAENIANVILKECFNK